MDVCANNHARFLLKSILGFISIWVCVFSQASSADQVNLNLKIENIELVTWEDRDIFINLENKLKKIKYHPMVKVVFSSPVNIMQLSQNGMNVWAESFISNGEDRINIKATHIYFEGFQIRNENRFPVREKYAPTFYPISEPKSVSKYMYSILLFTEWPSPYSKQEAPKHLLNDANTYSFRNLKSDITITINGVKPFSQEKLEAESIVIDSKKILNLINKE